MIKLQLILLVNVVIWEKSIRQTEYLFHFDVKYK